MAPNPLELAILSKLKLSAKLNVISAFIVFILNEKNFFNLSRIIYFSNFFIYRPFLTKGLRGEQPEIFAR